MPNLNMGDFQFPNFQNPMAFLLLLLIPLLYILRKLRLFNMPSFPAVLQDWQGRSFIWKSRSNKLLSALSKIFIAGAFFFTVTAFADPVFSHRDKIYTSLGTDIMFVLDTSPSMAAKDIDNTRRIDAAKDRISELSQCEEYGGNRYGIVIFGSNASVAVPPTADNDYFQGVLDKLNVGTMGNGSAIGEGLSTAVYHMASSKAEKKCIILLTDGENNAGEIHPETAAKLAVNNNINLYVVGAGSRGSVPIEYTDPVTGKQYFGYLDSGYDFSSLRKLANMGNGMFFEVKTIDELKTALDTVSHGERTTQDFTYKTKNTSCYDIFVFIAIVLIIAALFIRYIVLKGYSCFKYRKSLISGLLFTVMAAVMLFFAYSGISWGTYLMPVQKNSCAVSMVFDISNSMMAEDCKGTEGNISRLKASAAYGEKLLSQMKGIPTSVVLAKGDGLVSIPLTEDTAIIESLLEVMSPAMMTNPGSSLGKGIKTAMGTFPSSFSNAGQIWLFTDGEETDRELAAALEECIQSGISVTIIGFGSENESKVLAGDGKTVVKTALRTDNIENIINTVLDKYSFYKKHANISYIKSGAKGSGAFLLRQLNNYNDHNLITAYETRPVPRYRFFLILSIMFFALSYIVTEYDFLKLFKSCKQEGRYKNTKKGGSSLLCIFIMLISGCSSRTADILSGTYSWHKKQYKHSISKFINVADRAMEDQDLETLDYSLYDLGTAYLMTGEKEAALNRFTSLSENAPADVKYSAFYNAGILSYEKGNYKEAVDFFKKALKINNSSINAKINLELSVRMNSTQGREKTRKTIQAHNDKNENPDNKNMEDALFEHIKENDKKQWKNSETTEPGDLSKDY